MSVEIFIAGSLVLIAGTTFLIYIYVSRHKDGYIHGWLDCMEEMVEELEEIAGERKAIDRWKTMNLPRDTEYLHKRSGFLEEDM